VTHVVPSAEGDVRFGFIVARNVGGAVVRNTVRRRLKAVCAEALELDPTIVGPGTDVVIRALPGAGEASYSALRDEVHACLKRSFSRMNRDSLAGSS
jgi:ribonuclease P protein component